LVDNDEAGREGGGEAEINGGLVNEGGCAKIDVKNEILQKTYKA